MEEQFTASILQALQITASGAKAQADETEKFLMEANNDNQVFFCALFKICVNETLAEGIRMLAAIIVKRQIMTNWKSYSPEIQALFKASMLDLVCSAKSVKTAELLSVCFYQLLLQARFPEQWPEVENIVFDRLSNSYSNIDSVYFLLLVYSKIATVREHLTNKDRVAITQSVGKFFPILEAIAVNALPNTQQRGVFLKLITKTFFKSFRYDFDSYIRTKQNCDHWFNIFLGILKEYKTLPEAAKWVTRILISVFRKHGNPQIEKEFLQFSKYWEENWGCKVFEALLEVLYTFDRENDELKIVLNISRAFFHIVRNKFYTGKYLPTFEKLFTERLFSLIAFDESQFQHCLDDPLELFKSTDDFYHDNTLRQAVTSIVTAFSNEGLLVQEIMNYCHKVVLENKDTLALAPSQYNVSVMRKEAAYFLIEKLTAKINAFQGADQIVVGMIQNYVIPDINSANEVLRTRSVSLLKELVKEQEEKQDLAPLYTGITEKLCQLLQDPYFSVRGVAALTLQILLRQQPAVVDFIRPHVKDLLAIYVKLIDECDNELLINSLTEIFETYGKELTPHAVELLQRLSAVVIRLYNKQNDDNKNLEADEIEQTGFSIMSTFSSMGQILKSPLDKSLVPACIEVIYQMSLVILKDVEFEMYEELLTLFNLLIRHCEKEQVSPALWKVFEFICYSLNENQPLPPQHVNALLGFLSDRSSYKDLCVQAVNVLRSFVFKGVQTILASQDELGNSYFNLLFQALEYLRTLQPSVVDETQRYSVYFFKANLILELRGKLEPLAFSSLIKSVLSEGLGFIGEASGSFVSTSTFLNSLGICFAVDPITSYQFFVDMQMTKEFLKNWINRHQEASTFRIRKASFMGLLSLLQHYNQLSNVFAEAGVDVRQFILILLKEVARLSSQYEFEVEQLEDDDLFDDDEDDDEDEDYKKETKNILEESLDEFHKRLTRIHNNHTFDLELLISYDHEFTDDSFGVINHSLLLKGYIEQLNTTSPGLFNEIFATLDEETQKVVKECFEQKA